MDWKKETKKHIKRVKELLGGVEAELCLKGNSHDASKLKEPEAPVFAEYTSKLKDSTYNSPEYKQFLSEMKPALDHHYVNNPHHPEHFKNGIKGMSLIDLTEMLCDWKAASERHNDGSIDKSLKENKKRFGISDDLMSILTNTAKEMGWIKK